MMKKRQWHAQMLKPLNNKPIHGSEEWLRQEKTYKNWSCKTLLEERVFRTPEPIGLGEGSP